MSRAGLDSRFSQGRNRLLASKVPKLLPTGLETATRSSCGDAPFVNAIRSLATDTATSRRTMNITTGSGSVAAGAPVAGRLSPSCRRFRSLTPTIACWRTARRCDGVLRSTAPGKRRRPRSKTPIACPIPPPSAAGFAAWTPPSRLVPFYTKRSSGWPIGWGAALRPFPRRGPYPS
jgi:hypothetical protein